MAFALSMDAFSLSIGMGLLGLRYRHILMIGSVVGLFHVWMPLIGLVLGKLLSQHIGIFAFILGGSLLILLGAQMILSTFQEEQGSMLRITSFGILLFAVSVSLDSFSAGLSLGMLGAKTFVTLVSFGVMSGLLTCIGLLIGKKAGGWLGGYSEWLGGCILISFGIKIILSIQ
ncbi:manganese efflux pump MntP family protein [Bacillus shivajii]|uniref:manganese efflux pump MntP n=1 Tax=Bacillus shivajii TaxID=1983719 RepID=UPI001CFC1839|nr:manganese efflux pump [Bacillus shivajii]UCZ55412.1 manganese efflux pump MntP family protein [Bacillus shivajii]